VRLQTIGKRIGRDPVALLIAAYVATTDEFQVTKSAIVSSLRMYEQE
jgi:hypothetical protein